MALKAQEAVPNKLPVKLLRVAGPFTLRDPVTVTLPVNWCVFNSEEP